MRPRRRLLEERRSLTAEQRAELRGLLAAVPGGADEDDPAIEALSDFLREHRVPMRGPWQHWPYQLLVGDVKGALAGLRRLAVCLDWGLPYGTGCDGYFSARSDGTSRCERCDRRAKLHAEYGPHRTLEDAWRLGIIGCDLTDMMFEDGPPTPPVLGPATRCPRCRGGLYRDADDASTCLACGWVDYAERLHQVRP